MYVDRASIRRWNLANQRAITAYAVQMNYEHLICAMPDCNRMRNVWGRNKLCRQCQRDKNRRAA